MATCGSKREISANGLDILESQAVERGASFECIPGSSYCEQDHKRIGICDQDHHYIFIGTCPGHWINGIPQATCGKQQEPVINGTDAPEPRSLETRASETCVPGATYCQGRTIVGCDQNHNTTVVPTCPYKCIQYNDSSNTPIAACRVRREAGINNPEKSLGARGDVLDFQNQYHTECMGGYKIYFAISEHEFFPI
ncbi:hypothetical protein BCR34DRAFT_654108 [Clohesyomyces aquaticus]|uniref:Uncharacterized protein n=1 Tax=Clohesyomyces aquaticus TaxID=1231657 RepID=A0A1Y1ZKK8_9PLEO|nr:hypothetical protein BCR34DRAFT_654108 [Clohesyomyces aquaticus]